jgi:hypothetical protein
MVCGVVAKFKTANLENKIGEDQAGKKESFTKRD